MQFDEVVRASENLVKSTRTFGGPGHGRRESVPTAGGSFHRQYSEFVDPRFGGPPRQPASNEFDSMRSHSSHSSSSLQGYLANQRFGGPRLSEAEQMMQAKRRAAAQREKELRNYHQEQQYNRNGSGPKSDRSMSPTGMSEEDRRELIARQHRALYGNESNLYANDGSSPRPVSQDARVLANAPPHGSSSMGFNAYGAPGSGPENGPQMSGMAQGQTRSRSNSTASPAVVQNQFAMYDNSQQGLAQPAPASPSGSPTRSGAKPTGGNSVAPIGTRPGQGARNTPPVPSPLGYGFSTDKMGGGPKERSQSSASNPAGSGSEKAPGIGWSGNNGNNGPWGPNKMQASVWG